MSLFVESKICSNLSVTNKTIFISTVYRPVRMSNVEKIKQEPYENIEELK